MSSDYEIEKEFEELEQENKQLQQRIDKAIEIIKLCDTKCAKELLEILVDKEKL